MRSRIVASVLGVGLLLTACGGGSEPSEIVADEGDDVTLPTPAEGPAPELPVVAGSAASPLPEVAVRRINGEGGWVQFKNELPAEQPLLVWFWAPH